MQNLLSRFMHSIKMWLLKLFRLLRRGDVQVLTVYFDRNVFDQIDRRLNITDEEITTLRRAVSKGRLTVLISFEVVQETAYAAPDKALRGLHLIKELCRENLPIKSHNELLRDDIEGFVKGGKHPSPFIWGKFNIDSVIRDVENQTPEFLKVVADDKRNRDELNAKLTAHINEEKRALGTRRPASYQKYWEMRASYYAEAFAHFAGYLEECRSRGIDNLLQVRSVRLAVAAWLSLFYSLLIEGRVVKRGTSRDIQQAAPMAAADVVVTNDIELLRLMKRIPIDNFKIMSLRELLKLI
jgi:hypothetical protein